MKMLVNAIKLFSLSLLKYLFLQLLSTIRTMKNTRSLFLWESVTKMFCVGTDARPEIKLFRDQLEKMAPTTAAPNVTRWQCHQTLLPLLFIFWSNKLAFVFVGFKIIYQYKLLSLFDQRKNDE
jgi:hypothetical protein